MRDNPKGKEKIQTHISSSLACPRGCAPPNARGTEHPHDAIWLPNGDFVLCCWSGPSNPGQGPSKGTISYWEKVV